MITIECKILDIRSSDPTVMISKNTASRLQLRHDEIVSLKNQNREMVAGPAVVQGIIEDNRIGLSEKDALWLGVVDGDLITVLARKPPMSYDFVKRKFEDVTPWTQNEISTIVNDISKRRYTSTEVASFALVSQFRGYTSFEMEEMSKAMAEAGTQFDFKEPTFGKHSIGGIPGNKITPVIVPIVAAAGLLIPKTSSRAITSPSGTADTMEVLAEVEFQPEEITEIAPKSRGMIVWNAPLQLSPLDDIVIDVKRHLGIDPQDQMLASIVSTKIAMGINNLVFDIPTGQGSKMPDRNKAINFAHTLIGLCRGVGIRVEAALTLGEQPLGYSIGPALEAKEALEVLEGGGPNSVIEKSVDLAGILLEMGGLAAGGSGADVAMDILKSGKALAKFKDIIEHQGGDPKITSADVQVGTYQQTLTAPKDGYVVGIDNKSVNNIAKAAGCPKDKESGIVLHARQGDYLHQGDPLFTIYSVSESKLSLASQTALTQSPMMLEGMIIRRIVSISEKKI
ncbi:MAG: AMP phosphorylase [Candidatus Kariarchaeaceae archaeon]